jgi:PTH1 family peptidyl-tRNA hydrolase
MNNSGLAVAKIIHYLKISPEGEAGYGDDLLVIHDDLDLPLGTYRQSFDSSSAGQKGVQSIIDNLKTKKFKRLRLGVKTEDLGKIRLGIFKTTAAKFVLARFPKSELAELQIAIKEGTKHLL